MKKSKKPINYDLVVFWVCLSMVLSLQLIVCLLVGGRLRMFRLLGDRISRLPLWLFTLLDWGVCTLVGIALGRLLRERRITEEKRYRCGFFLVLGATFSYFWCALFFGTGLFLPAFVFSALSFGSLLISLICYRIWRGDIFFCMLASGIWLLYRMIFTLFCLFSV